MNAPANSMDESKPGDLLLVTGASGFVGSAIANAARAQGYRVRVLVRPSSPRTNIAPGDEVVVGDIRDRAHGLELVEKYGVDGVMIGRGIFANPYAFTESYQPSREEMLGLLHYHLDLYDKFSATLEHAPFDPLKRFFKIYVRDMPGAAELRDKLMHTKTTTEVREILATIPQDHDAS